jgi:hypothetical protein
VEQATGYHFYTLGFLMMAICAARRAEERFTDVEEHVHRAFRAGAAFRQPDGRWPLIGDVDSARSIPVHYADFWEFSSLCHVGAVLYNDSALKVGRAPGEELLWLFGCEGVRAWHAMPEAPLARRTHLEQSGYALATDGTEWLLFDAGPVAAGLYSDATPSAAHGHLDALQVLYSADGGPVLVDGGMPYYFRSREWVRHFRGSAAHNTLEIEGIAPAREAGQLAWSHVRQRPSLIADLREDVWLAHATAHWDKQCVIERHVLCLPGKGLWIADWIELDRERTVRWHWQLAPWTEIEAGPTSLDIGASGRRLRLKATGTQPVIQQIVDASPGRPQSWIAPGYGSIEPSQSLVIEASSMSILLLTSIARRHAPVAISRKSMKLAPVGNMISMRSITYQSGSLQWRIGDEQEECVPEELLSSTGVRR